MISIYVSQTSGGMEDVTVDVLAKLDTEYPSVAAATLRSIADNLSPIEKPRVTRERGAAPGYAEDMAP